MREIDSVTAKEIDKIIFVCTNQGSNPSSTC